MRNRISRWVRTLMCGATALVMLSAPTFSQDIRDPYTTPDWGEYPLLMSQFGELCTMCVAYLECLPEDTAAEAGEGAALYYFQTKDFWGQIQTIWDYYAKWFNPVTSESRPATVYSAGAERPVEAYLDKKNGIIQIDGTWIDRNTSAWFTAGSNQQLGFCHRPSIQTGLAIAATYAGTDSRSAPGQP